MDTVKHIFISAAS